MGGRFPDDFRWGVATSAFQIEGAVHEDGRRDSIWDTFCRRPGAISDGSNADVACDHYHRWPEDLDLLAALGVRAYRFSLGWARVMPAGHGQPNERGLGFYDRLIDALLERGIEPCVTLNHWDLPQALQDEGGWPARDTMHAFVDYGNVAFRAFGDRVPLWITHNEPWVVSVVGHQLGIHAPGIADLGASLACAHHLLVSHGLAVQAFRSSGASGAIGITLNLFPTVPATDSEPDAEAARGSDGYTNRWYLDPVLRGSYPDDTQALFERVLGRPLEFVRGGDLDAAATRSDFLGVNYYHPRVMRSAPGERFGWKVVEGVRTGLSTTGLGYEIVPEGLFDLLTRIAGDYPGVPLYVTENGAAFPDAPDADGSVRDPERIDFLRGHLDAAARAIAAGVDLRGYFAWSLMDNFEWALGYGPRFGLVHTDYRTLARSRKSSFAYYRDVIAANAVVD